ncbi:MAG TPA: CDP-glycerol glycerophosphotransferase family protein [Actinomycetota bacterium]|nr:CDP-glycerol glycerophosphotransferase family protein [Actinomycetota bacterium]
MSPVRKAARVAAQRMYARWRRLPLQDAVLCEAYEGTSTGCNPGAVAEYLLAHTDLPVIWALREPVAFKDARLRCVRYRSASYYRALATTRFLVNNVTFPPLFDKRDDQVYLNTWHGTPLKRMGRDVDAPFSQIANTIANFEAADTLLSASGYMTEVMYRGAYGVAADNVVELGSPRVDVQFAPHPEPDLVLYAPTWQEATYTQAVDDLADVAERMTAIAQATPGGLRPVLRVHGKLARRAADDPRLAGFLAAPVVTTNELLASCHTLITDFSSVAFDHLATGSRQLFFTPMRYARGVYLDDDELPGPRTADISTLQQWLAGGAAAGGVPVAQARARFCPHEDGKATVRTVERLLGGG